MSDLQPPRGTHDLLPEDQRRHRQVTETAREIAARYGFEEISTPVFEAADVFSRTLGETSDIEPAKTFACADPLACDVGCPLGAICLAWFVNNMRRKQYDHLFMAVIVIGTFEQLTQNRYISEQWYLLSRGSYNISEEAADNDGLAVLYHYVGRDLS